MYRVPDAQSGSEIPGSAVPVLLEEAHDEFVLVGVQSPAAEAEFVINVRMFPTVFPRPSLERVFLQQTVSSPNIIP